MINNNCTWNNLCYIFIKISSGTFNNEHNENKFRSTFINNLFPFYT